MSDDKLFTGKTVEDAIAEGLRAMGLREADVEIEVINRGSRGLFGLGSEPAQVRLTPRGLSGISAPPRPEPSVASTPEKPAEVFEEFVTAPGEALEVEVDMPEPVTDVDEELVDTIAEAAALEVDDSDLLTMSAELLAEMIQLMGFDADITASWQEPDDDNSDRYLLLDVQGKDLSPLIGRRGETLNNLQYLLRLMVNQRIHRWKNIVVDVDHYRKRHAEHLSQLALRSAEQVASTGRTLALEPMPPADRRLIHLALRDHADVITESIGEGDRRKVQILPRPS